MVNLWTVFFVCAGQVLLSFAYGGDHWHEPNPVVFNIGGVLSGNESKHYFKETIAVSFFFDNATLKIFVNQFFPRKY